MKAEIIDTRTGHGRKQHEVVCACGARRWVYVWSWAGNGKVRCRGCGQWIEYGTMRVYGGGK